MNLDPDDDGEFDLTVDHELMVVGEVETTFTLLDVSIVLPLHGGAVVHWKKEASAWYVHAAIGAGLGLTTDTMVDNLAGGETGQKIKEMLGEFTADIAISCQVRLPEFLIT